MIGVLGVFWPAFVLDSLSFLASFVLILGLPAAIGRIDPAPARAGDATAAPEAQLGIGASLQDRPVAGRPLAAAVARRSSRWPW